MPFARSVAVRAPSSCQVSKLRQSDTRGAGTCHRHIIAARTAASRVITWRRPTGTIG
jgi:hypothetical protein